ncbi:hypothetical protein [Streptomyces purpureus]|uniref:hypothetical protein n=1 Tax=Streptomyces purpureus TaxID=1951 RepID=UPI0003A7E024|nr:hypothetical protein [Streptomyces purpureus]
MAEPPYVRNDMSGRVEGHVVQAGAIHGDVVFPPPSPVGPEQAALQRRMDERARRLLDAEDAERAAAAHQRERLLRMTRIRKVVCAWMTAVCLVAVGLGLLEVVPAGLLWVLLGGLYGAIGLAGWVHNGLLLRRLTRGR